MSMTIYYYCVCVYSKEQAELDQADMEDVEEVEEEETGEDSKGIHTHCQCTNLCCLLTSNLRGGV